MSPNEIPPVFTAEEWARRTSDGYLPEPYQEGVVFIDGYDGCLAVTFDSGLARQAISPHDIPGLIAVANHALPDNSPFKITRDLIDDIESVNNVAEQEGWTEDHYQQWRRVNQFTRALTALLPPETLPASSASES